MSARCNRLNLLRVHAQCGQRGAEQQFWQCDTACPRTSIAATILPQGDSDWYRVSVDEQGALDVAITGVPANLDIHFPGVDAERQVMSDWYAPLAPGGDTKATVDLPTGGSYVLEVHDGRDDARAIEPYLLQVTFTPTQDRGKAQ